MPEKKLLLPITLLWLFSQLQGSPPVKITPVANVLVITLDTTRADRIGIYGYKPGQTPHIDGIARKGVRFENAYTPAPLTLPAHCSLFTGDIPLAHGVRNNGRYRLPGQIDTLAEILLRRGFTTAAFVSSFTLESRFGLDQGFATYNDNLPVKKGQVKTYSSERTAEEVFADFAAWFENFHRQDKNKKFFAWVHFFDPHMPYTPPEPFKTRFQQNPYDGEIAYMDVYIGKIMTLLEEKQALANTLIVIVGDHGEAFGEHGEFGHMVFCYEENLRVPLVFYAPGRLPENKSIADRANLVDIMPTILDFLAIPIQPGSGRVPGPGPRGISLLPLIAGAAAKEKTFYIESVFPAEALGCAPVKGLIKGEYKFIDLPHPELYRLATDPGEKENLFFKQNAVARQLKQTLAQLIKQYEPPTAHPGRKLSADEERKLKSLGYFSSSIKYSNAANLPDPKDKIASLTEFVVGSRLKGEGKTNEAIVYFNRAIELNPTFSWPYSMLAQAYLESGKIDEALNVLKKGIAQNPGEYQLKIDYTLLLKKQARWDEAIEILKGLLRQEGGIVDVGPEVYFILGDLYTEKRDAANAISNYRPASLAEPENFVIKQKLVYLLHQSKKYPEALEIYRDLEKATPGDAGLLLNMAILYEQIKKYDLSKTYYLKLVTQNPAPPVRVYYNYALLLAKTGNFQEAAKQMQRFIDNYPADDSLKNTAREYLEKWKSAN
ncbi:MAG: sulfatase-like hydrolase/transferase [Candidatus Aminicenantes bacterium]|nr:sulfatase-like hydrolase/transferase [Candidatus Aminicenantes bacterium]